MWSRGRPCGAEADRVGSMGSPICKQNQIMQALLDADGFCFYVKVHAIAGADLVA
jgi:hypothetical protein